VPTISGALLPAETVGPEKLTTDVPTQTGRPPPAAAQTPGSATTQRSLTPPTEAGRTADIALASVSQHLDKTAVTTRH